VLSVLVVLADTTQFGVLFYVFTTVLVSHILLETSQVSNRFLWLHIHFFYAN